MRFATGFALGATTAFFFDPRVGRGRRHEARDRSLRQIRRAARLFTRKSKHLAGRTRGVAAEARSAVVPSNVVDDDTTVKQRIMSEALGRVPGAASDVHVDVENGVARLFGTMQSEDVVEELVSRVRQVPGVRGVSPALTVAGAPTELDQGI